MATIQNVTIYLDGDVWCYAAWLGDVRGELDHTDTLDASTEREARAEIEAIWPGVRVTLIAGEALS